MNDDWPWDQAPDCGVLTLKSIIAAGGPILHVFHDPDDHGWQFLGWDDPKREDAALVLLSEIDVLDPTLREIARMPAGWHAWRRSVEDPWTLERIPKGPDDED